MADDKNPKKGMRTFASDLARVRKNRPKKETPKDPTPVAEPKPAETPKVIPKKEEKVIEEVKITEKKPEKPTPKQIPKTLSEEIKGTQDKKETIQEDIKSEEKESPVPIPAKPVGGGKVITSNKKGSFSFFSSLGGYISGLFKRKPKGSGQKMAIPETRRRKGVIQEATTKTGTIFTADSETLKERIRKRRLEDQAKKESEPDLDVHEPIWTPNTEPGYDLLEGDVAPEPEVVEEITNVQVELKHAPKPTPPPVVIEQVEPEIIQEKVLPPVAPAPAPAPARTVPEPAEIVPIESEPIVEPVEIDYPIQRGRFIPVKDLSTNSLSLYVIAILCALGALGLVAFLVYNAYTEQTIQPAAPKEYLPDATDHTVVVDEEFSTLKIKQATSEARLGTHEFTLENKDGAVLPTALVFDLVTPGLSQSLQQYVTEIRFISIDRSAPITYIVFSNQSALQGEMLLNEAQLAGDFNSLYPAPTDGKFFDEQIDGVDARVLTDEVGRSYFTYGFVDDQTLIVTGNLEDFVSFVRN